MHLWLRSLSTPLGALVFILEQLIAGGYSFVIIIFYFQLESLVHASTPAT